jgi:hypothetical protein
LRLFSWGFVGVCMHQPFVVLFSLIPLPNLWEKGLDFGVFVVLGFFVFLAEKSFGYSWFNEFWWTITWLWSAHEVFLLSPMSCSNPWRKSGDRELDWSSGPTGSVYPELPRLHRSDRCSWPVWPVWALCGICLGWVA